MQIMTFYGYDMTNPRQALAAAQKNANDWLAQPEHANVAVVSMTTQTLFHGGFHHIITLALAVSPAV